MSGEFNTIPQNQEDIASSFEQSTKRKLPTQGSGSLLLTFVNGNSGGLSVGTGIASSGRGGSILLTAGSGDSGVGGTVLNFCRFFNGW
jgi:hypothetical protein